MIRELALLEFLLEGQRFAITCELVNEVLPMLPIRQLAGAPPAIIGVVPVRGSLLPLLDPRPRLDLPPWRPSLQAHILSLTSAGRRVGLVVDTAEDVFLASPDEICHPGALEPKIPYQMGVLRRESRELLLLDLDALVNHDEWGIITHAARQPA